eukprot:80085_1
MADENYIPQINEGWALAMICCGFIGFTLHLVFVTQTSRHYCANMNSRKAHIFVLGCLLLLCFNMVACLLWAIARTNIIFPLSITACKFIYASNFLSYFMGKYTLHCLLIFRIYMTFRGSTLAMSFRSLMIFISIVSINFFIAMSIWTVSVSPAVLQGQWIVNNTTYSICTLFSDSADHNLSVKLSAITVGIEDFIVGSITFVVFLRRFQQIAIEAQDIELLESSTRFGVAAFFSVISTLFLFTLAIPFYPNMTFILAIDATINSLCLFCVLSVGQDLYWYVCAPCRISGNRWLDIKRLHPNLSGVELAGAFMNASHQDLKANIDKNKLNQIIITSAGGSIAVLAPMHGPINVPKTPLSEDRSLHLDPVASLILIKGTQSNSIKHKRFYDESDRDSVAAKPRLRISESAPVPSHIEHQNKTSKLKNRISLSRVGTDADS